MKKLTNILLLLLGILVLGFTAIVIFNIFFPPKPQKPLAISQRAMVRPPIAAAASLPLEKGPISLPQTEEIKETLPYSWDDQADLAKPVPPEDPGPKEKIAALIAKMASDNTQEALKAQDELVGLGKPALEALLRVLAELAPEEELLRPEIAFLLGRFEDPQAIPELIALLGNDNSYIRRLAVESLARIRSQEAVSGLINQLSDEDELVRQSVIWALGEIRSYEASPDLLKLLKDEEESQEIKLAALKALASLKDSRMTAELLKQLNQDAPQYYKDEVVESLGQAGDKQALLGLSEYLEQLKNNKPQAIAQVSSWQNSIEIAQQSIQNLSH